MNFPAISRTMRARGRVLARRIQAANAAANTSAAPAVVARIHAGAASARSFSVLQAAVARPSSSFQSTAVRMFSSASSSEDVPVPSMGDSISEGTVVEWLKSPGDAVEVDEVVVVLETDKVSVDVRAPFAGVLDSQLAKIDDNVNVGAPLFRVTKGASASSTESSESTEAKKSTKEPKEPKESKESDAKASKEPASSSSSSSSAAEDLATVNVPSMGDSISEGTVVTIFKNVGDYVRADEPVLVVETDKVSVDVNAPFSGRVTRVLTSLDDVVQVGAPLFELDKAADAPAAASSSSTPADKAAEKKKSVEKKPEASKPSTKKQPDASKATEKKPEASTAPLFPKTTFSSFSRNETRVQMSVLKVRAAQRQKDTQNTAAMLSTFQECDVANLLAMRDDLGKSFAKAHGVELGIMSTFLKASAFALQHVPAVNSFIDMDEKEIVYNDFVDINVAVASERGVVVPVIRNVEQLGLADIEKTLQSLGEQARDGSLAVEDLAGGTFTVSNSGVQGSLLSTSMLTAPQSAILGVHGIQMRPSVVNGAIVPRPMMFLSLTYDHRIIDGREGVTFLKTIADAVADPRRLLLEL